MNKNSYFYCLIQIFKMKRTIRLSSLGFTLLYGFISFGQSINNIELNKFNQVMNYIDYAYVDSVDDNKLIDKAITSMLEELDPHSAYIPKKEVERANESIVGGFVGVGIRFQIFKDTLNVVSVIPGGPSEKVGLQDNDKIIAVNGKNIAGIKLNTTEVRKLLMGELNTIVKVSILRGRSNKPLDFTITRGHIRINSVDCAYMIDKEIGYIKLNSFSQTTTAEMDSSITLLKNLGMSKLILDLQNNPGGLMYAAKDLADNFLSKDKLIVYSQGRRQPRIDLKAGQQNLFEKGNLVILINEFSASASEIVTGAVQDWDRGLVVGRRSFGKGLVQKPIPLLDGSQLRLTIARYYTPSGRNIQKPYTDDVEKYERDYLNRLKKGELTNQDSIHFADSLKYYTLIKKRTVYGGGGIMPDVFVPLDTSSVSPYFNQLFRSGSFNSFAYEYVRDNRKTLMAKYPDFKSYKEGFSINENLKKQFTDFATKEDSSIIYKDDDYQKNKSLIEIRLKGIIASDLYGFEDSFQILNELNDPLKKAVEILQNNEYKKFRLAD